MICVGTALLHPLAVDAAVDDVGLKATLDDGLDVALAVMGGGGPGAFGDAYQAAFAAQLDQVAAQLAALAGPGGPLAGVTGLGELLDGGVDVAAALESFAGFLCELEPGAVAGMLAGLVGRVGAALPFLEPAELATRVRTLATAGLATLEGPLLSGRDDAAAHRSYRAAAALRHRLDPFLAGLEDVLRRADFLEVARGALEGAADLDEELVERIRGFGCMLRDQVVPLARCASAIGGGATVTIEGGPQGRDPGPVPLDHDVLPAPHPPGHLLWVVDLLTNAAALIFVIRDSVLTRNPAKRCMQLIFTDILRPLWVVVRAIVRAAQPPFMRGPPGDSDAGRDFARFLFSDLGDFVVHFTLELLGSVHDMAIGCANWVASMGQRIVKHYGAVVQFRALYLLLRGAAYVRQWSGADAATRPKIPVARYAWLVYGPAIALSILVGVVFGYARWESYSLSGAPMAWAAVIGLVPPIVSWALVPYVRQDGYGQIGPDDLQSSRGEATFALAAAAIVMLIATQTLREAEPGPLVTVLCVLAPLLFGVLTAVAAEDAGRGHGAYYFLLILTGLLMAGVLTVVVWWWLIDEGRDKHGAIDHLDPATSPYRLPWTSGGTWMCGQDSHGMFSHQYEVGGKINPLSHYSYDFSAPHGSAVLAARTGLVTEIRDMIPNSSRIIDNHIIVQHLDWVAGHDPGTDEERILTYAEYVHLAKLGALVGLHQLVRQGEHIGLSDDTGISAMHHLHFAARANQNSSTDMRKRGGTQTVPAVFREGKPKSLRFVTSANERLPVDVVGPREIAVPLAEAKAPGGVDHTHVARFRLSHLTSAGELPVTVELLSGAGSKPPRHRHELKLTRAQLVELLRHRDVAGVVASDEAHGHSHRVAELKPRPDAKPETQGSVDASPLSITWDRPPGARLVAGRRPHVDGYHLLGHQLVLRVNGRTTEWYSFGAHRARVAGTLTLDRGPGKNAAIEIALGTGTPKAAKVGSDLMARAAAAKLGGPDVLVRAVPVLVLETRRRGTLATLELPGAAASFAGASRRRATGSGAVGRLDAVPLAELATVLQAALGAQAVPPFSVTGGAPKITVRLGTAKVSGFAGSSARIEEALRLAAPTGQVAGDDPLPLGTGELVLVAGADQLTVPISGSPARIALTRAERAKARLDKAHVAAEPLVVKVRDDAQPVHLRPGGVSAAALAQQINNQAEGVRAWADGSKLVIETIAAGTDAGLELSKGKAPFPTATAGEAPKLGTRAGVADTTSVTIGELRELIASAHAEASRPAAPATVQVTGDDLEIVPANAGDAVAVSGPRLLMAALGAAGRTLSGTGTLKVASSKAALGLTVPGWLDVKVGAQSWRVDLTAEPARIDVPVDRLPTAKEKLALEVDGVAVDVEFRPGDVRSLGSVADRIARVTATATKNHGLTARIAYRYVFEGAQHGSGNLEVGGAASPGAASAGVGHGGDAGSPSSAEDVTAAGSRTRPIKAAAGVTGRLGRAFTVAASGKFASTHGDVTVAAADVAPVAGALDPLKIAGKNPTFRKGPFVLGRTSARYLVSAGGTETTVELSAAPAHVATPHPVGSAGPPFDPTGFEPPGPHRLSLTVTAPAGARAAGTAIVDLTGAADAGEAARIIQREAPFVECWFDTKRLHIATRGGGTDWGLRLGGEAALLALGFDPDRVDGKGLLTEKGAGNVADGDAVTLEEAVDIFQTMGGLATFPAAAAYTATAAPNTVTVAAGPSATVTVTADPPAMGAALPKPGGAGPLTIATPVELGNGWLVVSVGGAPAGTVPVWGRRAAIEADDPLDLTKLTGVTLTLKVDGTALPPTTLPAVGSVDDLLSHLNLHLGGDAAWFGTVTKGSSHHLRIESRTRGKKSEVELTCSTAAPLGFRSATTGSTQPGQRPGGGIAANLAAVTAAELKDVIEDAIGRVRPQRAAHASVDTGRLRAVATPGPLAELDAPAPLHGLGADRSGRKDVVEYGFAGILDLGADAPELRVRETRGSFFYVYREIHALVAGDPARVGPMQLPSPLMKLNGLRLRVSAGTTTFTVAFAGVSTELDVVDQVQRAGRGAIRAAVQAVAGGHRGLVLATRTEGSVASLEVTTDPAVSTAFPTLQPPPAARSKGWGTVEDGDRVKAQEYADAINAGALGPDTRTDRTSLDYEPIDSRNHVIFESQRGGCDSSLEILPADPAATGFGATLRQTYFDLDVSMERGPAVRASVSLPGFADGTPSGASHVLAGALWVRCNDNPAAPDLAPATDVEVTFGGGTYDAAAAAAEIDTALAAAGAGRAAAYRDHTIVVETAAAGLAGTVTIPAPGKASSPAVLAAFGITAPVTNRGWPGAGSNRGTVGFRGHAGKALAGARWEFAKDASTRSRPIEIKVGDTPATAAAAVDRALRDPIGSPDRIGMAAVGDDGALYVEIDRPAAPFSLAVPPLRIDTTSAAKPTFAEPKATELDPKRIWLGSDAGTEPAFELRRTDVLRTCRAVHLDRRNHAETFVALQLFAPPPPGTEATKRRVFDLGWLRLPTNEAGRPVSFAQWAEGRWLFGARVEGARSDTGPAGKRVVGYAPEAEMIASGGVAEVDGKPVHIAHRVRYWVKLFGRDWPPALRVVRFGDRFLVDFLVT